MSDPSELKPKSNFRGTPYEEWVVDNPFEDELESRTKHLNNLRQEYIDAGAYTEDTELRFQDAFKQRLIREDILTPSNEGVVYDAVNEYTGLAANAQDNVDFIRSRVDDIEFEKGEEEKVLRYISAVDLGEELPEDFDVDGAEEIIREKRQDYITDLFEKDELGAGIYYDKEGNRVFLGGKVGENLSEGDVIKQGAEFGVTPLDVFNLRQKRTIREDRNNLPVYKIEQREAAEAKIRVFLDPLDTLEDDYIKAAFDALALNLAKEKSWGWLDKSVDSTGEVLNWMGSHIKSSWNFWTFDKKEMDETDAKRRFESLREQMEDEVDETKRRLMGDLQKRTGVSGEILEDVVDDIIRQTAAYGSNTQDASLNFTDDEDDLAENVLRMKYKPAFVQEGLHLYPEKFKKALADSGFSEKEIEIEDGRRVTSNEMLADGRIAALMLDDDYSTELNRRVIQGTQKGLSKGEILEQFVIDEDPNLGLAGIGMSIGQSVSTLWYGGGALFGFDWGKEGLIQNSKDQAHLQQMRTIFGQEAGTGQQLLEQAAPLLVDGVITVGAGLLAPVSAGTSVAAAGGYFGAKATASTVARNILKTTFTNALKQKVTKDAAGKKIKETLTETVTRLQKAQTFKGVSTDQMMSAAKAYNNKLAKSLNITAQHFVPAAMRSGSMTYAPVYTTVYNDYENKYKVDGQWAEGWSEERVKELSHKAGFESMVVAGTTTGLITAAMGKIGGGKFGGVENAYLAGVSMRQMKVATDRIVGRVSTEETFKGMMRSAVKETFTKSMGSAVGRTVMGAIGEGFEEGLDEIINTTIQDAWTGKETSFKEKLEGGIHGFLLGAILGGAAPVVGQTARNVMPNLMVDKDAMLEMEKDILARFDSKLSQDPEAEAKYRELEKVAPQLAAEIKKTVEERAAPQEQETPPDGSGESGGSGSDSTISPEDQKADQEQYEEDLETNIKEGDQEQIVKESQDEAKKKASTAPAVTDSGAVNSVTQNDPDQASANADVTNSHPSSKPPLTPEQKYELAVLDIQRKEKLYNDQQQAIQELPPALQAKRRAAVEKAVAEGRMITPDQAGKLIAQANRAREKQIADDAKPAKVSKKDLKALEEIINEGFPVADIEGHLEQLGITLERTDRKYLRAVEKVIKEKIQEKYPPLNPKRQDGGARLPNTLVPSGTVIINKDGIGVFNNDPAGMLTLLQNNVSIPITEEQATNPNTNKSFVIKQEGDEFFVTDIMVRVKGGLVSAKTPITKVAVHETNYGPVKDKIRRVNNLKNTVDLNAQKDAKVESPFRLASGKKPTKITFAELLKEAKNLPALKRLITEAGASLSKDYVDAAAITMSLDLQEQIYNYAKALNEQTDLPRIDLEKSATKNANFFGRVEADRKSKATRDLASVIEPDSDIYKDPNKFDADKQTEDNFIPPTTTSIEPIGESKLTEFISEKIEDAATALAMDENLRRDVKKLLNEENHGGKKATKNYSAEKLAVELVHFLATQGGGNKPAAVLEQKLSNRNLGVMNPTYKLGQELKDALTLLGVTSPVMQGNLQTDPEFYSLIESQLQSLVGPDVLLTFGDVKTFYTQVRQGAAVYKKRAVNDGRSRKAIRKSNAQEIEDLGLRDGDPESVIEALEEISKSGPKPLRVLAKALLRNKEFIRSVVFDIHGSPMMYAGAFYVDGNGNRTVVINTDRSGARGVADTLIHEYLHAFTRDIIATPESARTPAQNEAIATLEKLLAVARKKAVKSGKRSNLYATSNLDEFLTHILTSPDFQNFVNGVIPADSNRSLLQKIYDSLAKMLRLPSRELRTALEQALDLTQRGNIPEPETKSGYANQVAGSIDKSQTDLHNLSKDLGMAEQAAIDEKLELRASEVIEFASEYIPRELNVVVDDSSSEIASVDSETGAVVLNAKRAALHLAKMGSEGADAQRRKHAIGIILNKAIGKAAADNMISDSQYVAITESMSSSDLEIEIREGYPLDEQEAAFDRLRSADPEVAATEKFNLTKKALARHTELASSGMTSNEQVAFLTSNPKLIPTFIQYMKAFLSKLTYHRTLKDVSPEMRKAVNNIVIELRALELGYKPAPSVMAHDPRNPTAVVEQLMQQAINVNRLEPKDSVVTPVALGSPAVDVPFSSETILPVNTAQTEVDDAMLNGRDDIDTGIKGSAVHELAKFMDSLIPTKEKIDWQKNWRGQKKSFKGMPQKEKAFNADIERAGTRIVGVIQRALNEYPEFVSWYEERVGMAMDIFEELDPDAASPEDSFILKTLMTVTSNGNKVKEQTEDSWALYQNWKKTGKLVPATKNNPDRTQLDKNDKEVPISWIRGDRQDQIKKHLALVDTLVEKHSWEVVSEFFSRSGTRAELIADLMGTFGFSQDKAKKLTEGELMDEQVPYSLVFGAKLGSFYNNLNGDFETITMDRWFMRTFGRTIGAQLRKYNRKEMAEKHARFDKALAEYLKLDPKGELIKFADSQRTDKSKLDPIGRKRKRNANMVLALAKYWTSSSNRQLAFNSETGAMEQFSGKMSKVDPITNELRLATNGLSKAIDSFELIEAPASGGHRRFIRLAMMDALGKLENEQGIKMVPAEAQAILWYYEKALHAEYGSGKDGEAPDYATAANEVFTESRGTSARSFRESTANIRGRQLRPSTGGTTGGTQQVALGQPASDVESASSDESDSKLPDFLDEVEMQDEEIGNWFEALDVPLLDFSEDYELSDKSEFMKLLFKKFVRKADKRVVNFYDTNKAFIRENKGIINEFQERHNRILKEENSRLAEITGRESGNIPPELIAQASGSNRGTQLSLEQKERVQEAHDEAVIRAREELVGEDLTAAIDQAAIEKEENILRIREANRKEQFAQRDKALGDLLKISPKMYELVLEMRQLQDKLSKQAIKTFGPTMKAEDLHMAFDFNRGIYLTRTYRMFEDNNFAKRVKESEEYADVRERAAAYMMSRLKREREQELMNDQEVSPSQAKQIIEEEFVAKNSKGRSRATAMVSEFIDSYSTASARTRMQIEQRTMGQQDATLTDTGFRDGDPLKKMVQEINKKEDIPEPIRELLGEYGDESGLLNLSYTLGHTASLISNQAFFNKLKAQGLGVNQETGKVEGTPWLITEEQRKADQESGEPKYTGWKAVTSEDSDLFPLTGMYIDPEVSSNLQDLMGETNEVVDQKNQRKVIQALMGRIFRKTVGLTLALKTLGSPAFYIRNVIGNALYFGPMQGYYGGTKDILGIGGSRKAVNPASVWYKAIKGSRADLDFALIDLKTMNVFGDELEVSEVAELMTGGNTYQNLEKELTDVGKAHAFIQSIADKQGSVKVPEAHIAMLAKAGVVVSKTGMAPVKALKGATNFMLEKGGKLASAADGFFKVGLYDFELQTLTDAAEHEINEGNPTGPYGRLLKDGKPTRAMKEKAAEIVKDTAQSYSRAIPVVKDFGKNPISLAMAPYVRFAADVPRVYLSGLKKIKQEAFDSDNPVIRARGRKRFRGAIGTTAFHVATTKGTQMVLWGIDDEDEDKAFRSMVPKWMKEAGLFIYKTGPDQYYTVDLTYINPFATIQDPVIKSIESLLRGEGLGKASMKFVKGVVKPFANEQILVGAMVDAVTNKDQYDRPLRLEGDDDKWSRSAKYVFDRAFSPRSLIAAEDAYDAFLSKEKADTWLSSGWGKLFKSVSPFVPHPQDMKRGYKRYLIGHTNDYRDNNNIFSSKMTDQNLRKNSDSIEAYERYARVRRYQNNEFKQILRGFKKLGLTDKQINEGAKSMGVSKERLKHNAVGYMNRPIISSYLQDRMNQTRNGRSRFNAVRKHYLDKYPDKFLPIDQ